MSALAFLFPGQGSQYIGMCKALCKEFAIAEQVFEETNDILGFDIKRLCFDGDINELTKTYNTQPVLLTASMACFKVYMQELGIPPIICAGHSLGEISALTCSGVILFRDAIKIVRRRGELMQKAMLNACGGMAAIKGLAKDAVEEACARASVSLKNVVVVSNYNSKDQIVISGHQDALEKAIEIITGYGARVTLLKVSAAFHSPLMKFVADEFRDELESYTFYDFKWPVVSNVTGLPYSSPVKLKDILAVQITSPVQWESTMQYIDAVGISHVVELGSKAVLKNLFLNDFPDTKAFTLDKSEDFSKLEKSFKKKSMILNKERHKYNSTVISKCLATAISIRNQNWNENEYFEGVIEPLKVIRQLHEDVGKNNYEYSTEQAILALRMLKKVFMTKKVPNNEQTIRINQILSETQNLDLAIQVENYK